MRSSLLKYPLPRLRGRVRVGVLLLFFLTFLMGCGEPNPGVKDAPPPKGGPPQQERHPPGLPKGEEGRFR